jgi:hypothetical protein
LFHPGLLQNDFTQPNGIRIAMIPPRQGSAMVVKPLY